MIMHMIKKILMAVLLFFKTHKKKWLLFFLFSILFFLLRFPYESAMLYLISHVQKKTGSAVQIKYESFYINPLNPSLVFRQPEITIKKYQSVLRARQLQISPSYTSLLRGKAGGTFTLKWPSSSLKLTFRQKSMGKNKKGWLVQVKSQNTDPSLLGAFVSVLSHTKGKINLDMELWVDPLFETQPEGFWRLTGRDFQSQALSYTFPGDMGAISLPHFKWLSLSAEGQIKKGEISLTDISCGDKKDSFQIQSRGIVSLNFTKQTFSKRVIFNLKSYSLGVKVLVREELQHKLRFLDWFLEETKRKTPEGWLYMAHIKGNRAIFDPSPVDKLPTLSEIKQSPTEGLSVL